MSELKVYNTLGHKLEPFETIEPGKVRMYVCGPTTYNYIHLGNARPIVVFDTIRRYLTYLGYDVTYISNFTDVDDKIIRRAQEENTTAEHIADTYIEAFFEDVSKLNVLPATNNPRVSQHMDEIIDFVQGLVDKGFAYPLENGDVYYRVRAFPEYGQLSGRNIDELQAGARVDVDENKEDPLDFALWKHAKAGEPSWESPWGAGRPGWHIECSAMSHNLLGDTFDIHGGGEDLVFPHHENEIAQSCALTGKDMARYWIHNGFITINEEKMSKSKGNFFMLREILERFPGDVVRYYLLSVHYRSPLDFDDEKIEAAERGLERIKNAYDALVQAKEKAKAGETADFQAKLVAVEDEFKNGMNEDFNTALGLAAIFDLVRQTNTYLRQEAVYLDDIEAALALYDRLGDVFGLDFSLKPTSDGLADTLMNILIEVRNQARQDKNWDLADAIRDQLHAAGIELLDGKEGTSWKMH